jgi:hypothetical protein
MFWGMGKINTMLLAEDKVIANTLCEALIHHALVRDITGFKAI